MRFLISPHPHADLVIGAHSIHKNNLLTVPNFMAGPQTLKAKGGGKTGVVAERPGETINLPQARGMTVANVTADETVAKLQRIVRTLRTEADHLRAEEVTESREEDKTQAQIKAAINSIKKKQDKCKVELELAEKRLVLAEKKVELGKAESKKLKAETIKKLKETIKGLEEELNEPEGNKSEEAKKKD